MRRIIAVLVLCVGSLVVNAPAASAHTTSYCGTGWDGFWWQTRYEHTHWIASFSGYRRLNHYTHWYNAFPPFGYGYHHEEHRYCS